jgi:hypothetical protein
MLTAFDNVSFFFVAPDVVKMGDDIKARPSPRPPQSLVVHAPCYLKYDNLIHSSIMSFIWNVKSVSIPNP